MLRIFKKTLGNLKNSSAKRENVKILLILKRKIIKILRLLVSVIETFVRITSVLKKTQENFPSLNI